MKRVEVLVQLRVCCPVHCTVELLEIDGAPPEIPPSTGLHALLCLPPLGREHDGRKVRLRGFFYDLAEGTPEIPQAEMDDAKAAVSRQLFA